MREPFVKAIGELPLSRRPLYELLGFEDGRDEVNGEYAGYGWCQPARIWLDDGSGEPPMRIDAPLVVAVHAADEVEGEELGEPPDDVILEFAPPDEVAGEVANDPAAEAAGEAAGAAVGGAALAGAAVGGAALAGAPAKGAALAGAPVRVLLSAFLERWLPRLPGRGPVVLSMCNPRRATVRPAKALGGRPLYYAIGDVESWLDEPEDPKAPGVLLGEDERRAGGMVRLLAEAWHQA